MSEKQYRDKIVSLKKQQGEQEAAVSKARAAAAKYRAEARKQLDRVTARTSASSVASYQRTAEAAEKRAIAEDRKVSAASSKLATLARDLASAEANLDREVRATARREEESRKTAARRTEQQTAKRRTEEKRHAREIGRLSRPTVIHEVREVIAPKPETLRVLYLTANPDMNVRVDVEVRQVEQAVRSALHRDQVEISKWLAATPEDLLQGLNDIRPHVVHFSGHAGAGALVFDNASVTDPEGRDVTYDLLARALAATSTPPVLLVLNGCDTLDGAEVLLDVTPVVVAMDTSVTDLAAVTFAAKFYGAIAAAQPVEAALGQAAVALDLAELAEGWKPRLLVRADVSSEDLVLVRLPPLSE
jgi:hypothetical protein